jgi:hypothetical protein
MSAAAADDGESMNSAHDIARSFLLTSLAIHICMQSRQSVAMSAATSRQRNEASPWQTAAPGAGWSTAIASSRHS